MAKGLALEILKAKPFGAKPAAIGGAPGAGKGPADAFSLGSDYKDAGGEAAAQAFLDAVKSHDAKKLLGAFRSMRDICQADNEATEAPEAEVAEGEPAGGGADDIDAVGKG